MTITTQLRNAWQTLVGHSQSVPVNTVNSQKISESRVVAAPDPISNLVSAAIGNSDALDDVRAQVSTMCRHDLQTGADVLEDYARCHGSAPWSVLYWNDRRCHELGKIFAAGYRQKGLRLTEKLEYYEKTPIPKYTPNEGWW